MLWFAALALQAVTPAIEPVPIIKTRECAGCSVLRDRGLLAVKISQTYLDETGHLLRVVLVNIAERRALVVEVGKPDARPAWIDMGKLFTPQRLAERAAGKRTPIGVDSINPAKPALTNR